MHGVVCGVIAVQQVQLHATDLNLPGAQPDRVTRQGDFQPQPLAVRLAQRCDRQLPGIVVRQEGLLGPILIDHLPKIALAVEQPDADDWNAQIAGRLELITGHVAEPAFRKNAEDLVECRREAAQASAWFQKTHPQSALTCAAYFSMEFMLSEALPIYSGGLGNVAGDQLKAASELGVPVAGVGLLYGQGYFRQDFDSEGRQQALYPVNDPGQLPIRPLRQPNGE